MGVDCFGNLNENGGGVAVQHIHSTFGCLRFESSLAERGKTAANFAHE